MRRCHVSGSRYIIRFVFSRSLLGRPSIMYPASVNGAPENPMSGTVPSSFWRVASMPSKTYPTSSLRAQAPSGS